MSLSPLTPFADTQADISGPAFFPSLYSPQSPQQSQIPHPDDRGGEAGVEHLLHQVLYGHALRPDLGVVSPCDFLGYNPHTYNTHTPSMDMFSSHYPAFDDESTSSQSAPTTPLLAALYTCICGCGGGPCIRQRPYRRPKGDPLEDDRLGELIIFRVHGQCGMPLSDALRCVYSGLSGRDDPMFVGSRTSISIRLEWPGVPSWAQQMRTKDWRRKPSPITKAKLATEIAKKVDRFLKDEGRKLRGLQGDASSTCDIDISRVVLVALEHVSQASWQPHLRLI